MNLIESEREKYESAWSQAERLVCHGLTLWRDYRFLFPDRPGNALDIGCGTGHLIRHWRDSGIYGYGYDIAASAPNPDVKQFVQIGSLWRDTIAGAPYDMGCCADVMEHLPPDTVSWALENIHSSCDVVVYKIANFESTWNGHKMHLTLRPRDWWHAELERHGDVRSEPGREGIEEYIFRVETYDRM